MRAGSGFARTFVLLLGVDKNTEAFHSLLQNNNRARALLPVFIYLALKTTHHTAIDRREKRNFLATFTLLRERTNAFSALVFLFLSRSVDNTHRQ
jgi:hypothetical protein